MQFIRCRNNNITDLNVSNLNSLLELYCTNNQLQSLNVKNTNNLNFITFDATGNPSLTCISVNEVEYMNANWSIGKDENATFNIDCSTLCTLPPVITSCPADITVCQSGEAGNCDVNFELTPIPSPVTLSVADRFITYSNVSINESGNQVTVAPGATISLAYDISVTFDSQTGYCPSCVVQSSIGIGSTPQRLQCENPINDGYTNSYLSGDFAAPTTPGVYYLTQYGTLDFFCQPKNYNNIPSNAIAVIIVGSPIATATSTCSNVTITNNAPACFPLGTTSVIWTATDIYNNISTCTQNVTVTPATIYYPDNDSDGSGNPGNATYSCSPILGLTTIGGDCNDYNSAINPSATEIANGLDDNCDGNIDDIVNCNISLSTTTGDTLLICNENNASTGNVNLVVTNGLAPYIFSGSDTLNLLPGIYNYQVTDANGCSASTTLEAILTDCIIPYYQPPANDTISNLIGSELTQLFLFPESVVDTNKVNNIFVTKAGDTPEETKVLVEVIANIDQYDALLALLQTPGYGLTDIIDNGAQTQIITGFYPISKLKRLDSLTTLINYARNYYTPIASSFAGTGLTITQGDKAQTSDRVKEGWNVSGSGIKVGVISDSYNTKAGNPAALDVQNGDLPGAGNPNYPLPVIVTEEYPYGKATDEGRAMLQIVHDVAPNAQLYFKSGFISAGNFADGIKELRDLGCKVIVDDITYMDSLM